MNPQLVWMLVVAAFCIAVILLNLWTLNRAEKVEKKIASLLIEHNAALLEGIERAKSQN